jgi:hypothetical protein
MPSIPITETFGLEAIRRRAPEWLKAMSEGFAKAPRCGASTRNGGGPCRKVPLKGQHFCPLHLAKGIGAAAKAQYDIDRTKRARQLARSTNAKQRHMGERMLQVIARNQLHYHWKMDAREPGSTIELATPQDRKAVAAWLLTHGVDLDTYRHTPAAPGLSPRPLTPRARDRLTWAGALSTTGRCTPEAGRRRVVAALRDDLKFWTRLHEEHGE